MILPPKLWRLGGARPLNHPQRRLGALATLAREWPASSSRLRQTDGQPRRMISQRGASVLGISLHADSRRRRERDGAHRRYADGGHPGERAFPFLVLGRCGWPGCRREFAKLSPARLSNRRLETAATRLFGDDPRRTQFMKTVAQQQGLLQIHEDFCMQDNSDCAQ